MSLLQNISSCLEMQLEEPGKAGRGANLPSGEQSAYNNAGLRRERHPPTPGEPGQPVPWFASPYQQDAVNLALQQDFLHAQRQGAAATEDGDQNASGRKSQQATDRWSPWSLYDRAF